MKEQFLLKIQFAMDEEENKWWIGTRLDQTTKPNQNFYKSEEEARCALKRLLWKFNKEQNYEKDGNRRETTQIGNGFSADIIINKSIDELNRIVAWKIEKREVTPWELVEASNKTKG